ncbi:hypothetical protein KBK19_16185 [Microvirga sp. STR05]|uniref:XRE family transcriptional regulator n=1 Tax=Hymenobacter duratus TaxID=2771356 RepID=A0ABR8JLV9_9BACT|nr:hypothetical protein [Hymenobacter duratus]MBD2716583.1 hypothetical protein [Hymenobacter duratus]MBR7951498.1 hypothetical protein [Microvirga sp. STR05]
MAESATVGQRFVQLISHLGISKNAFANSLDKTATVVQHLVEERNKPGFDLLCKVFEVYPNVSKEWLIQGSGPMLISEVETPTTALPVGSATPATHATPQAVAPAATKSMTKPVEPADEVAAGPQQPLASGSEGTGEEPAPVASAATVPSVPPATPTPVVMAAPAPEAAWQAALYTQQMAHQLAMAELRNQHLQDQQRLMQQMLDLMQRKM